MIFTAFLIPIRHVILSFCASSVSEVEGCDVALNLPLYQAVGDGKENIHMYRLGCIYILQSLVNSKVISFTIMIISLS